MTETGTAILVDGENISHAHASRILGAAAALAPIRVARVYGHVPQINGWAATAGFVPVHTARAKDGADLVLAIEAVALSHAPGITHLVIATSDGGLAPLVHHLRAAGRSVLLMGEVKTPEALRLAASHFRLLAQPEAPPPPAPKPAPKPAPPAVPAAKAAPKGPPPELHDAIRRHIPGKGQGGGSLSIAVLGQKMQGAGFPKTSMGHATWTRYLQAHPDIYRIEGEGPDKTVFLR